MDKALLKTQRSWIQETCLRRFGRIPHTYRQNFVTDITLRSHIARNRTAQAHCTATLRRFTAQWRVRFPVAALATNNNNMFIIIIIIIISIIIIIIIRFRAEFV